MEAGTIESCIIFTKTDEKNISMEYVTESVSEFGAPPESMVATFKEIYKETKLQSIVSEEELASLNPEFNFSIVQTAENAASGNIAVVMMLSIALFYAIYFCAYQVSSSITTEKTSRIIETLVTSTKPRTIVLGKTVGMGIVGLLQIGIIILVAILSAKLFMAPEVLASVLDMSNMTIMLGVFTFIYFILGYSLYSLLYALVGSTVSKPEDIQSANSPIAILAVLGFYLAYFSMMNPTSDINVFASIFPLSSPFSMPFRIMLGTTNATEIAISLGVMLVFIALIAQIAIKIYSSAILNYGTKLNIKDMFKIYKDKNN